jgi:hypothetical protein
MPIAVLFMNKLFPVKYVPSWVPGAGFQRKAKAWSNHLSEMRERPFKLVEDQLVGVVFLFVPLTLYSDTGGGNSKGLVRFGFAAGRSPGR